MHHKFMIVDDEELITGSYNWSDTAEEKNYENIIHYFGRNVKEVIADFRKEFDKLWDLNRDRYEPYMKVMQAKPEDDAYRAVVPVHFNSPYFNYPMTLTRSELAAIRGALAGMDFFDKGSMGKRYYNRETKESVSEAPEGTFLSGVLGESPGISKVITGSEKEKKGEK